MILRWICFVFMIVMLYLMYQTKNPKLSFIYSVVYAELGFYWITEQSLITGIIDML